MKTILIITEKGFGIKIPVELIEGDDIKDLIFFDEDDINDIKELGIVISNKQDEVESIPIPFKLIYQTKKVSPKRLIKLRDGDEIVCMKNNS